MKNTTVGILLYSGNASPKNAFEIEMYRVLAEKFVEREFKVKTLTYHPTLKEQVKMEALECCAVLIWVNPIEPGMIRTEFDDFVRDLSKSGILVSAHPDTILKIGTKDVLYDTQSIGWCHDIALHRSSSEFEKNFVQNYKPGTIRVLKQHRGNSGQGIWKVTFKADGGTEVLPVGKDAVLQSLSKPALLQMFEEKVFSHGSHLVDQPWVETIRRGMVRAYLCGDKVAGFGYQEINALYPVQPQDDFTRRQTSRRYYFTEECFPFQKLRQRLENEWIPKLLKHFSLKPNDLALIWDTDFFFGPGQDEFILCEINSSCVSPFPESAVSKIIDEVQARLKPYSC